MKLEIISLIIEDCWSDRPLVQLPNYLWGGGVNGVCQFLTNFVCVYYPVQ